MQHRRAFLLRAACLCVGGAIAGIPAPQASAQTASPIRMVSRERLLRESAVARLLRAEEQRMTELLQAQVDQAKLALAGEEAELAEQREQLSSEAFEQRIKDFDARMRRARLITQERAAILQKGFQDARAAVVAAIPAVMEQLRRESGAVIILNADQALAGAPGLDLTDRAIALFDRIGPEPQVPQIDLTLPVTELTQPEGSGEAPAQQ